MGLDITKAAQFRLPPKDGIKDYFSKVKKIASGLSDVDREIFAGLTVVALTMTREQFLKNWEEGLGNESKGVIVWNAIHEWHKNNPERKIFGTIGENAVFSNRENALQLLKDVKKILNEGGKNLKISEDEFLNVIGLDGKN